METILFTPSPPVLRRPGFVESVMSFIGSGIEGLFAAAKWMLYIVIAGGLIFQGCMADTLSKTAIQQTVATIQYCTGFLMLALIFVINELKKK